MPHNDATAASIEDDGSGPEAESRSGTPTQAEAVREAVRAGHDKPATGVPWIERKYGLIVGRAAFSAIKSKEVKRVASGSTPGEPRRPGRPLTRSPAVSSADRSDGVGVRLVPHRSLEMPVQTLTDAETQPTRNPMVVPPPSRPSELPSTPASVPQPVAPDEVAAALPPRPVPDPDSLEAHRSAAPPETPPAGWRELLHDLRTIRRLKAKYGDEFGQMVEEA